MGSGIIGRSYGAGLGGGGGTADFIPNPYYTSDGTPQVFATGLGTPFLTITSENPGDPMLTLEDWTPYKSRLFQSSGGLWLTINIAEDFETLDEPGTGFGWLSMTGEESSFACASGDGALRSQLFLTTLDATLSYTYAPYQATGIVIEESTITFADFGLKGSIGGVRLVGESGNTWIDFEHTTENQLGFYTDETERFRLTNLAHFLVAAGGPTVELADGATITPDGALGNSFHVVLGGNRTIANMSNLQDGYTYILLLEQDATGGRTVTWGAGYVFDGGSPPDLAPNPGDITIVAGIAHDGLLFLSPGAPTMASDTTAGVVFLSDAVPEPLGTAAIGSSTRVARQNHVHAHGDLGGGSLHALATTAVAGFMSAADKTKLDGLGEDNGGVIWWGVDDALGNIGTTYYLVPGWRGAVKTNEVKLRAPYAGVLRNLRVWARVGSGGDRTQTLTVRKNAADTALVATLGLGATSANNTVDSVSVVGGDRIGLKLTFGGSEGNAPEDLVIAVEYSPE